MKPGTTGAVSGCVVWLLLFAVPGVCLVPIALALGGIPSGSDLAIRTVAPLICPQATNGAPYSYPTTRRDDNGSAVAAHCVRAALQ